MHGQGFSARLYSIRNVFNGIRLYFFVCVHDFLYLRNQMEYADVILPVPLDGAFTYSVPASFVTQIAVGKRVVVPFGKTKTLTGVVLRLHDRKPDVTCKDILRVLDEQPMVTQRQLTLWQWIADYYLSPLGDILKAALPSGLKDEEGYRPRTEQYVKLGETYRTEQGLHVALDLLRRAVRQKEVFLCYLQLSHWDSLSVETPLQPIVEVTREELMNTSHTTSAVLANLFSRKFLVTYEKQVGRLNDGGSPHPEHIKPLNPAQTAERGIRTHFHQQGVQPVRSGARAQHQGGHQLRQPAHGEPALVYGILPLWKGELW